MVDAHTAGAFAAMNEYLAAFPPMEAGRIRKSLERPTRFRGHVVYRYEMALTLAQDPACFYDATKERLWTGNGAFFMKSDLTGFCIDFITHLQRQPIAA